MKSADMVEVRVRGKGNDGVSEEIGNRRLELGNPHAGVDQEIRLGPPNMPDIATPQWVDMGLEDQRDVVVNPPALEPCVSNPEGHG